MRIQNTGDRAFSGETLDLQIGDGVGQIDIGGQPVESLRLTRGDGAELLYMVADQEGIPVVAGHIPELGTLTVPLECAANGKMDYFLYLGNDQAWRVPDFLYAGVSQLNGDLEDGSWSMPDDWKRRGTDVDHRLTRDESVVRSGKKSLRAEMAPDAKPTWFAAFREGIPVSPGDEYELVAWNRAEGLAGPCGWYVHVFDKNGNFVLNQLLEAGQGTFDWKRGTLSFRVPENGVKATIGTTLRGSGRAWYDLVSLKRRSLPVKVEVLPLETKTLRKIGHDAPWLPNTSLSFRAPLTVRNLDNSMATRQYAFDFRPLKNQSAKLLGFSTGKHYLLVGPAGEVVREFHGVLDDDLTLELTLPAETEQTFFLYLDSQAVPHEQVAKHAEVEYNNSRHNLLSQRNGNMEEGDGERPAFWFAGEEGKVHSERFSAERVPGGVSGDWCLKLSVPASVQKPGWVGWRQKIPVKPNTTYIYTGYIKTENTDTTIILHGHFHDKNGKILTTFNARGDGTLINNINEDWMRYSSPFTTPVDCAAIEVHLTMNGHGTIWHDAISVCELEESGVSGSFVSRAPSPEFSVWTELPIVKLFRHDIKPPNAELKSRLFAAGNSHATLQLALRSLTDENLKFQMTPPTDAKGNQLPLPAVFRAGFVPIDQPGGNLNTTKPPFLRLNEFTRSTDGWSDFWADPLIPISPDNTQRLNANETAPLLFDFNIPANAIPGIYRTEIRIAAGNTVAVCPVEIKVWNFVLADRRRSLALFDAPHPRIHGLDAEEAAIRMMKFLASYHVSPGVIPQSHQPVFRRDGGKVVMDTERFDQMCKLLFDELHVNMIYTPGHFYAGGWASGISGMFGTKYGTAEFDQVWRESYRLFVDHITRKGWRDRFIYYVADEPHSSSRLMMEGLAHLADMAREIAPDIPVYSSTWVYMPELENHLSMWGIGENGRFPLQKMKERQTEGDRFLFTTDGHFGIDTPLAGVERILPLLGFKYGVEGFEYWSVNQYTYNPWEFGWCKDITQSLDGGKTFSRFRFPNGDGYILYPGREIGQYEPVPSLRLLYARMGIDDNEIYHRLAELEKAGNPEAKRILDQVRGFVVIPTYPNRSTTLYSGDPAAFQKARDAAGEMLESL